MYFMDSRLTVLAQRDRRAASTERLLMGETDKGSRQLESGAVLFAAHRLSVGINSQIPSFQERKSRRGSACGAPAPALEPVKLMRTPKLMKNADHWYDRPLYAFGRTYLMPEEVAAAT